jgi:hypothetical protein
VALAATGMSNQDVATRFVVWVRTVEGQPYRAFAKLGGTEARGDRPVSEQATRRPLSTGEETPMTIRCYPGPDALPGDADRLPMHESARLRAAALHARRVLPGPLGELVHRELTAYAEFGYRFAADALVPRLADEILALRTPADAA